jgi:hypothetical protein
VTILPRLEVFNPQLHRQNKLDMPRACGPAMMLHGSRLVARFPDGVVRELMPMPAPMLCR